MDGEKRSQNADQKDSSEKSHLISATTISMPKGGGAIRGMGEKFAANPVTGTGSMSVPLAVSPGRSGFSPQQTLSCDSGSGNGPFGSGWGLSLPCAKAKKPISVGESSEGIELTKIPNDRRK